MWPFAPNEKTQSLPPKETSAEEDWDISLWLLDPDRTIEELDYFAQTGQRPTKAAPKENFAVVEYPPQKEKPLPNFPKNPNQGHTWLDEETGTYYLWCGTRWKVLANTPPQPKKSPQTKEGVKGVILNLKRPFFSNQLEEKEWCAREVALLLGCDIQVFEHNGVGYVVINGEEAWHPIKNWGWENKTAEEFIERLYHLWVKQTKVNKNY